MADTIIAMRKYGAYGSGIDATVPIKAVDLGDSTFAIAASTGTASAIYVAFPDANRSDGTMVKMATVEAGLDPTNTFTVYALKVTE